MQERSSPASREQKQNTNKNIYLHLIRNIVGYVS